MAETYFETEKISAHMTRIRDITGTACYLIEGGERACLLDTGGGFGSLRECVENLIEKDYFVILTHGHVDHSGGAGEFADKEVYLHPADLALMEIHTTEEMRLDYLFHTSSVNEETARKLLNREAISASVIRPMEDGQQFDLGGITVEIIHTPGHTQGMCMVLIKEERTILFGDGCGVSVLLLDEYASSVEEYREMLLNLKKYENEYDRIIRNHGTCESGMDLLDNVIECCDCILSGTDDRQRAFGLPIQCEDAYFAKAVLESGKCRVDGKEGNIAYSLQKIRK